MFFRTLGDVPIVFFVPFTCAYRVLEVGEGFCGRPFRGEVFYVGRLLIFLVVDTSFLVACLVNRFLVGRFLLVHVRSRYPTVILRWLNGLYVVEGVSFHFVGGRRVLRPIFCVILNGRSAVIF